MRLYNENDYKYIFSESRMHNKDINPTHVELVYMLEREREREREENM